ncbi:MAG: hypothetical protein AUF76_06935 [Acidobacteria bacterium 13_1_20CM_2_65_9]|nr:MAG: hypothetical protein AUF76_06935 [Acidobacteria bacterium 13_1_20CM_2_65_9]
MEESAGEVTGARQCHRHKSLIMSVQIRRATREMWNHAVHCCQRLRYTSHFLKQFSPQQCCNAGE